MKRGRDALLSSFLLSLFMITILSVSPVRAGNEIWTGTLTSYGTPFSNVYAEAYKNFTSSATIIGSEHLKANATLGNSATDSQQTSLSGVSADLHINFTTCWNIDPALFAPGYFKMANATVQLTNLTAPQLVANYSAVPQNPTHWAKNLTVIFPGAPMTKIQVIVLHIFTYHGENIGNNTLSGTVNATTPKVSAYDLLTLPVQPTDNCVMFRISFFYSKAPVKTTLETEEGNVGMKVDRLLAKLVDTYWVQQPPSQITVNFYTNPSIGSIIFNGTSYVNGQSGSYPYGTATATANPPSGYRFMNWSTTGGISVSVPTNNPTTVTVAGAGVLTANFTAIQTTPTGPGTLILTALTFAGILVLRRRRTRLHMR